VKQEVFVIGRHLRDLVPFSLTFMSPDYAVTLVEAQDVVGRATTLAQQQQAWFLLVLPREDDEAEAWQALQGREPAMSIVIEDGEDPVIALAHLIAAASWEAAALAEAPVNAPMEAQQQHG
jgi:hypothetical protein